MFMFIYDIILILQLPPSPVRSITSKQYNSPVGMYSDQSIAESLSAQAEVLAGGVLG